MQNKDTMTPLQLQIGEGDNDTEMEFELDIEERDQQQQQRQQQQQQNEADDDDNDDDDDDDDDPYEFFPQLSVVDNVSSGDDGNNAHSNRNNKVGIMPTTRTNQKKRTRHYTRLTDVRTLPLRMRQVQANGCLLKPLAPGDLTFRSSSSSSSPSCPDVQLKDYQWEGLNWLRSNWYAKRNSILADEMGLGKTVQSISLLHYIATTYGINGPFLIVVPLSTLTNWEREIDTWTHLNSITVYLDDDSLRQVQEAIRGLYANIVLTTYEMLKKHRTFFYPKKWQVVIFDEAHRLKTEDSTIRQVATKLKYSHLILMTGTPFQLHISDLFNLLSLVDPHTYDNVEHFCNKYGDLTTEQQVLELKQLISPHVLRRTKDEVLSLEMSAKEEIVVELELTASQKTLYRAIFERKTEFLRREFKTTQSMSAIVTALKKCCNHPFLLTGVEQYLSQQNKDIPIEELMIKSASKLIFLDKLLSKIIADGEKVLIFCQMLDMLTLLEDYLAYRKVGFERLDGGMSVDDRMVSIDKFNNDPTCRAFLLSTKAGGFGINLTAANHVVIYESDFNPFNDLQASARCHRIGQKKKVSIYRLIAKDTYETYILSQASKRLGVGEVVLGNNNTSQKTTDEIESMLRHGVYHILSNNDSRSGDDLLNENLSSIISRSKAAQEHSAKQRSNVISIFSREKSISHDGAHSPKQDSSDQANNIRSIYFVPKENKKQQIDINDKDFWRKMFPDYTDTTALLDRLDSPDPLEPQEKCQLFMSLKSLFADLVKREQTTQNITSTLLQDNSSIKELNLIEEKASLYNVQSDVMKLRSNVHLILLRIMNDKHAQQFTSDETQFIHDCLSHFEGKKLRNRRVVLPSTNKKTIETLPKDMEGFAKRSQNSINTNRSTKILWAKAQIQQPKKKERKRKIQDNPAPSPVTYPSNRVVSFALPHDVKTPSTRAPVAKRRRLNIPSSQIKTRSQLAAEIGGSSNLQQQEQQEDILIPRKSWKLSHNETCAACQVEITPICARSYYHARYTSEFQILFPHFNEDLKRVCNQCYMSCREFREKRALDMKKKRSEKRKKLQAQRVEPKRSSFFTALNSSSSTNNGHRPSKQHSFTFVPQTKPKPTITKALLTVNGS